jgi:hypothetical protein
MTSEVGRNALRIGSGSEILRDVAEFARRVRMALSFEKNTGMDIIVNDRSSQLCALVEQSGFILLGLHTELECTENPEVSLRVSRHSENPDIYRVDGFTIKLESSSEDSFQRASSWLSANGIDECSNIMVAEESGSIVVQLQSLS